MPAPIAPPPEQCNCQAIRAAARHVTQFYDQCLAPSGLRTSQFTVLAKLRRNGPLTINALAGDMVTDRTTLGRNVLPLERDGLITIKVSAADRRAKQLALTKAGEKRLRTAAKLWFAAQAQFDTAFGAEPGSGATRSHGDGRRQRLHCSRRNGVDLPRPGAMRA